MTFRHFLADFGGLPHFPGKDLLLGRKHPPAESGRMIGQLSGKFEKGNSMVGVERFELPTLWSQTRCATRLRYTP